MQLDNISEEEINAGDGIRTRERLRDKALNLVPLTRGWKPLLEIWI